MRRLILTIVIFLMLFPAISRAATEFTVGVSPPLIDMGTMEKGSTKTVKFYLVTPSTEPLLVRLQTEPGTMDFFSNPQYSNLISNYSEEDTSSWVEILKNPIELMPANESLQTAGGQISGWMDANFLLNVPTDAEPGYHLVRLRPYPSTPTETIGQTGTRVVAVTSVTVILDVDGDASRKGIILDVNPGDFLGNNLEINTYFQNTGTDTISAKAFQDVYNNGTSIANITSEMEYVKPGEVKILKSYLPSQEITSNSFDLSTIVSYTTGSAAKNSTILISQKPAQLQQPEAFPYWILILVVIVIVAALIYKWSK